MFSIGKMAKYCHTSVQTLRYYAKIGLLQASYQDPKTGYRYYKIDQIFQFTIIKYLQSTNLSLAEIQKIMSNTNPDMSEFWRKQEKAIQTRIEEDKKSLYLAQFQQLQAEKLEFLKDHLNKGTYVRSIKANVIEMAIKKIVTPADTPDNTVSNLDQKILAAGELPNIEYCFTFKSNDYKQLRAIHYLKMFKEISGSAANSKLLSGKYLGISFMWNRDKYLDYLNQLLTYAQKKYFLKHPLVTEDSFPLNYNQQQLSSSTNSITELRIKLEKDQYK